MLILTRKLGESIIIDSDIDVKILDVQGSTVRLGITAPEEVVVDRDEIHALRGTEHWKD